MEELLHSISARANTYVDELTPLLRMKSISPVPGYEAEVQECAQAFACLMENAGITSTVYQTDGNPIVFGQTPEQPGCRTILIYGHYDVQPEGDPGIWQSDPYEPVIRDGRIYARGVADNKGQIFAQIKGYEAFCKRFGAPKLNLKFLIEGEEESGSRALTSFAASHAELLKAGFTLWSDGNYHNSGRPVIILGLKGITYCHLTARGPSRDLHSQYAAVVENPVWKLVKVLSSMKDAKGHVLIPGFYDDVIQPGERELAFMREIPGSIDAYAVDWGLADLGEIRDSLSFYKKYMYEPTLNIGCIHAGDPAGGKNIVPTSAEAWLDIRLVPGQKSEDMAGRVKAFVDASGIKGIQVECRGTDAAYTPVTIPYLEPIRNVVEEVWGQEPVVYPGHGGSGPFHVFNLMLNAPCIMIPYADAKQNDHGPNESLPVENLVKGIQTAAAVIRTISEMEI